MRVCTISPELVQGSVMCRTYGIQLALRSSQYTLPAREGPLLLAHLETLCRFQVPQLAFETPGHCLPFFKGRRCKVEAVLRLANSASVLAEKGRRLSIGSLSTCCLLSEGRGNRVTRRSLLGSGARGTRRAGRGAFPLELGGHLRRGDRVRCWSGTSVSRRRR